MYSDANRYILRIVLRPHREIAVAKTPYCSLFFARFQIFASRGMWDETDNIGEYEYVSQRIDEVGGF